MNKLALAVTAAAIMCLGADAALAQSASRMTFFVTGTTPGKGGDLGGIAGADKICQTLAASVGAGNKTWRAYLSHNAVGALPAMNARDRIGDGPWQNAKGVVIARSRADLHSDANGINKQTALTEKGLIVNGRGDQPNEHDVLTGSNPDGTLVAESTCGNWTSSDAGNAIVGHHDRIGLNDQPPAKSWNSSHPSRGCSQDALKASGGAGRFYCFAVQ